MARIRFILPAVALVACTALTTLTGCSSGLTPELHSFDESAEQFHNRHARVTNNNGRQIWDDLEEIFLLNRTSRLQRFPAP